MLWFALGLSALITFLVLMWWVGARAGNIDAARARFFARREELQAAFFRAAASSGKPRGLRWKACDWGEHIEFAREKPIGTLLALVEVTLSFEAIEGGDMEGVAAVGNLRNASAVFFLARGEWQTSGKAIFNLNPDEAIAHFGDQYERLSGSSVSGNG